MGKLQENDFLFKLKKGVLDMKNIIRLLGIIVLTAIIGFFLVSCGDSGGGDPEEGNLFAAKPVASPVGGDYTAAQTVTLTTTTAEAAIYYTIDGTVPTASSTLYSGPIPISTTTTLKAIAIKSGMTNSSIMIETYIITPPGQVVQPMATPAGGNYATTQTVTLTTTTGEADIYYTLDGAVPTASSTLYSGPIPISTTTTLKAIAVKTGMTNSSIMTETYDFTDMEIFKGIADYLAAQSGGGSAADPVNLTVQMNLGNMTSANSGWQQLLAVIESAGKFVNLDLSLCTMTGTEFNPDYTVTTGKNKIVDIALPDTATSIPNVGNPLFENFTVLKSFSGVGLNIIGDYAFNNCTNLALTSLPAGLSYIGFAAFNGCTSLVLSSLPAGLTSIGGSAFAACTRLTLTSLPTGLISIGNEAFANTGLTQITLPVGINTIGEGAFFICRSLIEVTLPTGTYSIGEATFYGCTDLVLVTSFATNPPTLMGEWEYLFQGTHPSLQIKVPAGSVEAYKAAPGWSDYASIISAIP